VPLSLRYIAHALNGDVYGDCVRAPGPKHSAGDRSLSVKLTDDTEDVLVTTFSPRDDRLACLAYVREKCGIQPKPKVERFTETDIERAVAMAAESRKPKANIVAVYPYEDRDGTLLYQVLRLEPKSFRQRTPDGNGGWIWKLNGVCRVLYRWPELLKHPDATVFVCEGEKDANNVAALDLCATTVQGGKWTDECVNALVGRHCWILEDNDEAGRKKASEAATLLHPVVASAKIVRFPSLPKGGDVSDWLGMGHGKDDLVDWCCSAPDWEPSDASTVPTAGPAPTKNAVALASNVTVAVSGTITLSFFSDLVEANPKPWLIKNVIARGECSSWIAPPGKGKSALLTDIFVHGARGAEWRGYRVKAPFGGIYFALERVDLVKRRMTAHRLRDNLPPDLPIAIVGQVIDLMSRKSVGNIVDAIKRAEDRFGCSIGLVTFDTWAKAIAAGGGDESGAKDQNAALANLRRVLDRVHVHIATIGHTGKDESRGERGSNAKLADVDLQVQLSGDTTRSAIVKKGNDQPEGLLTSFRLEPFEFGDDEDGDPFRTFIVSGEVISDAVAQTGKLSDQQQRAIEALAEVTLSHGVDLPPTDGMPAGLKTITADQWRAELYRRGVLDQTVKNPRARFFELRNRLAAKHLIGVRDELVWLARVKT
jgi:AAA domain